jgi:hypothetical protein
MLEITVFNVNGNQIGHTKRIPLLTPPADYETEHYPTWIDENGYWQSDMTQLIRVKIRIDKQWT